MSDGQLLRLVLITPEPNTDMAHGILINVSRFLGGAGVVEGLEEGQKR